MQKIKAEEDQRNSNRLNGLFDENSLVYNALTGRMTAETSLVVKNLLSIGFGVSAQRQLYVMDQEKLNHFAFRVRNGDVSIDPKWPMSLKKVFQGVIDNGCIKNPAEAIQQLVQVKINSMLRSRYASVVTAHTN
uniref:Uncharacterized protein n=1 Tax=Lygus hesperus TaxID=30085 RepID=A0A146L0E1_LYGHE